MVQRFYDIVIGVPRGEEPSGGGVEASQGRNTWGFFGWKNPTLQMAPEESGSSEGIVGELTFLL